MKVLEWYYINGDEQYGTFKRVLLSHDEDVDCAHCKGAFVEKNQRRAVIHEGTGLEFCTNSCAMLELDKRRFESKYLD